MKDQKILILETFQHKIMNLNQISGIELININKFSKKSSKINKVPLTRRIDNKQ